MTPQNGSSLVLVWRWSTDTCDPASMETRFVSLSLGFWERNNLIYVHFPNKIGVLLQQHFGNEEVDQQGGKKKDRAFDDFPGPKSENPKNPMPRSAWYLLWSSYVKPLSGSLSHSPENPSRGSQSIQAFFQVQQLACKILPIRIQNYLVVQRVWSGQNKQFSVGNSWL